MLNNQEVYAVKNRKLSSRLKGRSGGMFLALTDYVIKQNGVIYGCILNKDNEAVYERATGPSERDKMCGSKYVQSNLQDVFLRVKSDVKNGRLVLFSGTPCYIGALKKFLGDVDTTNLFLVDILCHGVPSPLIWREYISYQAKRNGVEHFSKIDFRNKKIFGWGSHVESLTYDNKTIHSKLFADIFYSHNCLRPSCYNCPYSTIDREGDISLGDYWGIEKTLPFFYDDKGISLVIINTGKGKILFDLIRGSIVIRESRMSQCLPYAAALKPKEKVPDTRITFWETYFKDGFEGVVTAYFQQSKENITVSKNVERLKLVKLYFEGVLRRLVER